MQTDDERRQKIEGIISEKWPLTEDRGEAELLATWILDADQFLPMELGKFVDRASFKKLKKPLETICRVLPEISAQGRFQLKLHAELLEVSSDRDDPLVEFLDHASHFLRAIEHTLEAKAELKPPHGKTNWHAVSVFEACAKIWKANEGRHASKLNDETQHSSPFGLFVRDIYDALGIGSEPRIAQDRLAAWRKDQP